MAFSESRRRLIEALRDRRYVFEKRSNQEGKNLLFSGQVDEAYVIRLLERCRGNRHETGWHHTKPSQQVDIFRVRHAGLDWYIKSYFLEEGTLFAVFISVHH